MAGIKIPIEVLDKASPDLKRLNKELGNLSDSAEKVNKSAQSSAGSFRKSWTELNSQFQLISAGINQVIQAAQKLYEFGQAGAQIERLEDSFSSLAAVAGESGDELLRALDKAARGTVSNTELIQASNRAMMLGLGADAEQLGQLLEVAGFRGRAMGLSTTQAFNDIVTGIGRASPMILDNLGIVIDAEKTYEDYAVSIGKSASELTKAEKTQALMSRTIEEGQKQIALAGGYVDDTAASYERLSAAVKNYGDEQKKSTNEALEPTVGWLGDVISTHNEYTKALRESGLSNSMFAAQAREAGMTVLEYARHLNEASEAASDSSANIDGWGRAIDNTNGIVSENTDLVEDNTEALKRQSDAYQKLLSNSLSIYTSRQSFEETAERLVDKEEEIRQAIVRETLAWQRKLATGNVVQADYDAHILKMDQYNKQLEDNSAAIDKNSEAYKRASAQRIYDIVQQRLAIDGISAEEFEYLQGVMLNLGLVDKASADRAIQESQYAESIVKGFEDQGASVDSLKMKLLNLANTGPYHVQVVLETIASYTGTSISTTPAAPISNDISGQLLPGQYAEGGSFVVPGTGDRDRPYTVNLTPGELVTVTPRGESGPVSVNINVDSVRNLSDLDYLAQEVVRRITA